MSIYTHTFKVPHLHHQADREDLINAIMSLPSCNDVEVDIDRHEAVVFYTDKHALEGIEHCLVKAGFPPSGSVSLK